jgi:hypothetical protein
MTLDIASGHLITILGAEYSVRKCNPWLDDVTDAVLSLMTETCTTKAQQVSGGKRSVPSANLSNIACSPAWPASADTIQKEVLEKPIDLFECYLDGDDVIYHLVLEKYKQ